MEIKGRGPGRAIAYDPKYVGFVIRVGTAWQAHAVQPDGRHAFVGYASRRRDALARLEAS